jgi:TatD DNase family protein
MMNLADTHTHIYAKEFDADRDAVIRRSVEAGAKRLFLPAIDREHHAPMLALAAQYPELCFPMMGLHPTSVGESYEEELGVVEEHLQKGIIKYYAIGECGIDLYWDTTYRVEQEIALECQFDLAIRYNLPLVIHTRNSMDIALTMLENRADPRLRGIFHCFGGNISQAKKAISLGFSLGIGGVVTYRNSGLQAVIEQVSADNLVLETDAPWLPPVPHRGQRNEPAYLTFILRKIAEIKNLSPEEVAGMTFNNATRIFGI